MRSKGFMFFQKWTTDQNFAQAEMEMSLEDEISKGLSSNEITSVLVPEKPLWKRGRHTSNNIEVFELIIIQSYYLNDKY